MVLPLFPLSASLPLVWCARLAPYPSARLKLGELRGVSHSPNGGWARPSSGEGWDLWVGTAWLVASGFASLSSGRAVLAQKGFGCAVIRLVREGAGQVVPPPFARDGGGCEERRRRLEWRRRWGAREGMVRLAEAVAFAAVVPGAASPPSLPRV